ncbi:bifunctional methyltransferase/pyrophosphohydrolase YabN [Terrilactibacillus tamarindi]|uniref:nucleoside triphosphate pyrophosphohydrolase n=1 Tax=Terrilactibacillus tamarindi TaxID=2599694 RepID=UPI002E32104D|nr:nucleoside triphosphate pyrophosphohydrolase [Terrilactibacillus tamarindi]
MEYKIVVIGLGSGDIDQLTMGIYRKLKQTDHLYLRTSDHPIIKELEQTENLTYTSFDHVYESYQRFEEVYDHIADTLFEQVKIVGELTYAVPGHPMVAERTVQLLLERSQKEKVNVEILGGQSFLDPLFSALKIDPIEGLTFINAMDFDAEDLSFNDHLVICQVYDQFIASEVKLALLDHLPHDYEVIVITSAGNKDEKIVSVSLHELDHDRDINNLTSVYVPPIKEKLGLYHTFASLRRIIRQLRGPEGCPWDKAQTHESLRPYLVEETYEVLEAIDEEDDHHLVEELGDVLLQVMLHSQIGEDDGYFSIDDVIRSLSEKLVRRHPHVFGDKEVQTLEDVGETWKQVKEKEPGRESDQSILQNVNAALPPMLKAADYQKQIEKQGIKLIEGDPWKKLSGLIDDYASSKDEKRLGDVLFTLIYIAKIYKHHPYLSLEKTNREFAARVHRVEKELGEHSFRDLSREQIQSLWENNQTK